MHTSTRKCVSYIIYSDIYLTYAYIYIGHHTYIDMCVDIYIYKYSQYESAVL